MSLYVIIHGNVELPASADVVAEHSILRNGVPAVETLVNLPTAPYGLDVIIAELPGVFDVCPAPIGRFEDATVGAVIVHDADTYEVVES